MRQSADGILHLSGSYHHKVVKLVHDNENLRHCFHLGIESCKVVIGFNIPDLVFAEKLISLFHFGDRPSESACRLFRIGNNRYKKMGQSVVNLKLHDLRIDHKHLYILGRGFEKNT